MGAKSSVALLRYAIAALVVGPIATVLALGTTMPDHTVNYLGPLMMLMVATAAGYCLSRGHIALTISVLVYGVCAAITGIAAFTGGVRSPVVVVYPVLILVLGWLTDARAAMRVTLLTCLLTLLLWVAELLGWLPGHALPSPTIYIVHQYIVYSLAAVLIIFVLRAYERRLQELNDVSADLAQYTNLLEDNTKLLERAQAVATVGSWVADIPADLITPSAEGCQILGMSSQTDISYADYLQRVHADDRAAVAQAWQAALNDGVFDGDHRIIVNGSTRWIRQKVEVEFDASHTPTSALGIVQDITERKLAQLALRDSEERYRTLIEWAPDAILVQRMGQILYANPAAVRLFDAPDAQALIGKATSTLIHPDDREAQARRARAIAKHDTIPPMAAARFITLGGNVLDVEVQGTAIDYDGQPAIHVSIRDITARKRLEDEIKQLAFYDSLTQLPNRRLLSDRLSQALLSNRRSGCHGALMFLDLDNFKPLNDVHGHSAGDMLLAEVAARLKNCVRETDTVARFGGDEFVVLLTELDTDRVKSTQYAHSLAGKIKSALAIPYVLQPQSGMDFPGRIEHHCTASIGLVVYPGADVALDDLIKWADAAMYRAKEQGRNRICLSTMPPDLQSHLGSPDLFH